MTDNVLKALDAQVLQMRRPELERTLKAAAPKENSEERTEGELKEATEQFEALLLNMMIREMRETVPESGLFPESMAKEIYTGMLDEKIADSMAERGGIGISRMLFDQLKGN
jgi:flagellar protein FlgJ